MSAELIGNTHVQRALQKELRSPLLFYGTAGIGKKTFARAYFEKLLGNKLENHPDYRHFVPEGKGYVHTIARMHDLIREIETPPHSAAVKCILIQEADRFNDASSNALLKTLEEHPPFVRIVLTAENLDDLLPTIVSRCLKVPFHPASLEELTQFIQSRGTIAPEEARRIATLSGGSFGNALDLLERNVSEGERLLREWLANPTNRSLLDQLDKFVADDKKKGMGILLLLSRLRKGDESLSQALLDAEEAYRHHTKLSTILESVHTFI